MQFNNSWECSTIPYIPTLDLVKEHMNGICENDVDGKKENKAEILSILDEEENLAVMMYDVVSANSTVGFESANHYFFNKYSLAEKVVNVECLKEYFA